jgi:hypothetical protein
MHSSTALLQTGCAQCARPCLTSGFSALLLLMTSRLTPTMARAADLLATRRFLRAISVTWSFLWAFLQAHKEGDREQGQNNRSSLADRNDHGAKKLLFQQTRRLRGCTILVADGPCACVMHSAGPTAAMQRFQLPPALPVPSAGGGPSPDSSCIRLSVPCLLAADNCESACTAQGVCTAQPSCWAVASAEVAVSR